MKIFKYIKLPLIVLRDILNFLVTYMPGVTGIRIRRIYYANKFKSCGKNLIVDIGVSITGPALISVGDNVFIDKFCIISTGNKLVGQVEKKCNENFQYDEGEIVIGNNVHIAQFSILMGYGGIKFADNVVLSSGCKIYSLTNTAYDLHDRGKVVSIMPYEQAQFMLSPVVIEHNVWLGLNTIVMPGVVVGQHSFCVSNSLLVDSFEVNSYILGQPAKRIRERFLGFKVAK
jgi:acetyltransferase-like isoleucine patch superfamily enzyme